VLIADASDEAFVSPAIPQAQARAGLPVTVVNLAFTTSAGGLTG